MRIKDLYKSGRPVISFEVFPPKKDGEVESIYQALGQIAVLKPDFISVTYGAGSQGDTSRTKEIATHIQQAYGVRALAHLTCLGADSAQVHELLDALSAAGVANILALRGDPPARPEQRGDGGGYRYAAELIEAIRGRGDFCIGAACYPEGHIDCDDPELDIRRLCQKQAAGADFFITQLFFDNSLFFRFLEQARQAGITLPISAGVMPILSQAQIQRMIFMCGASLPSGIIKLLHKYEHSPADLRQAGIEHALAQLEGLLQGGAQGVHIYTMNKPDIAVACLKRLGRV